MLGSSTARHVAFSLSVLPTRSSRRSVPPFFPASPLPAGRVRFFRLAALAAGSRDRFVPAFGGFVTRFAGFVNLGSSYLTPTGNTFRLPDSGYLGAFQGANSRVATYLYFDAASSVTLQGLGPGSAGYYGDWGADQQGRLESYIGGSLPLQEGSGFGALAVVPEPATCVMALAGLACGGFSIWRRKRA